MVVQHYSIIYITGQREDPLLDSPYMDRLTGGPMTHVVTYKGRQNKSAKQQKSA
jgi:hypothetical protein